MKDIVKKIQNLEDPDVKAKVKESLSQAQEQIKEMKNNHPFLEEEKRFYERKSIAKAHEQILLEDLDEFGKFNQHKNMDFVKNNLKSKEKSLEELRAYTLNIWDEELIKKTNHYIDTKRREILDDFSKRIDILVEQAREAKELSEELGDVFGDLKQDIIDDFDVNELGNKEYFEKIKRASKGYDLSAVDPKKLDIQKITTYFKMIKNNPSLKEICKLLGKLKGVEKEERKILVKEMRSYEFSQKIPTKNSKEEISGVMLGRNLEELLPQELGLLNDEDLENLFVLKYLENRLFCFEKQGYISQTKIYEVEEEIEKIEEIEKPKDEGAMIICVDSSGSMSGMPEFIAKGITLFMAKKAFEEKRSCYLINFSSSISCMEIGSLKGMKNLFEFLSLSFNGGTDVGIALKEGVRKMQEEDFKKSDLLVISDGDFGGVNNEILRQIQEQREKENKFYLLDIDGSSGAKTIFDKHWEYSTTNQNVKILYEMSKDFSPR
ncbi:von Willebrand factor type A (vWA) domain-containing protein [Campylobacter lari]|uniref:hypothetical protein n=1 Tax=Campylobacter lari TaxID=201 RepID=UPI00215267D4|nr:hypothetical protein [Campylobacter lari]MCR6559154.1 hypothetical protein [Campylobacter lari]